MPPLLQGQKMSGQRFLALFLSLRSWDGLKEVRAIELMQ